MEEYKISPPLVPLRECLACKDGHTYKSVHDAVSHLKGIHFRYDTSLSQFVHPPPTYRSQPTYRLFVRSLNDVRNELASKQQLGLMRICLNHLNVLVARAEKIHSGMSHEAQPVIIRYQLPDDLVDCFEEIALFLMQTATSVVAIGNEMRTWQHVPGKAIDDLETVAVRDALEKLGELGQSAQAFMTKAEKTLALSGTEATLVSMGGAGPELLVSIVLQTLRKRCLIDGVDMDVNQLYQEYTSKLVSKRPNTTDKKPKDTHISTSSYILLTCILQQYQINQFPRKRLLRDIHALQEELSVVQLVNSWQQKSFDSLLKVLDPQSFDLSTSDRVIMFPAESECLNEGLKTLQSKAIELKALENRTQYLREQLKQSVEILEEDHGKAILVFTMITTIFLPL
jgi:hypothetical protein